MATNRLLKYIWTMFIIKLQNNIRQRITDFRKFILLKKQKYILPQVLILLSVLLLSNCEERYELSYAHTLPDSNTFYFDYEIIGGNSGMPEVTDNCSYINWLNAWEKIDKWQELFNYNIKVPILALKKSEEITIKHLADDTWVREFQIIVDTNIYEISLYSTLEYDYSVFWEMFVSQDNSLPVSLLRGEINSQRTKGYWIFYKYVFQQIDIVKIDWEIIDSELNVSFENVYERNNNFGDIISLSYPLNDTNLFVINNLDISLKDTTSIKFNRANDKGRIKSFIIFNDSLWHCWNSDFLNDECE